MSFARMRSRAWIKMFERFNALMDKHKGGLDGWRLGPSTKRDAERMSRMTRAMKKWKR